MRRLSFVTLALVGLLVLASCGNQNAPVFIKQGPFTLFFSPRSQRDVPIVSRRGLRVGQITRYGLPRGLGPRLAVLPWMAALRSFPTSKTVSLSATRIPTALSAAPMAPSGLPESLATLDRSRRMAPSPSSPRRPI